MCVVSERLQLGVRKVFSVFRPRHVIPTSHLYCIRLVGCRQAYSNAYVFLLPRRQHSYYHHFPTFDTRNTFLNWSQVEQAPNDRLGVHTEIRDNLLKLYNARAQGTNDSLNATASSNTGVPGNPDLITADPPDGTMRYHSHCVVRLHVSRKPQSFWYITGCSFRRHRNSIVNIKSREQRRASCDGHI
jgi:hypothetical protein